MRLNEQTTNNILTSANLCTQPITPTGQNKYLHRGARRKETICVDNTTGITVCETGSPIDIKMKKESRITSVNNITLRVEPEDMKYECLETVQNVYMEHDTGEKDGVTENDDVEESPKVKPKTAWE